MNEAKTRLSRLVDLAAKGEIVVIAKAGKPMVKMVPLNAPEMPIVAKRLGFLAGRIRVPHDFDTMGTKEIERTFGIAPRGVRKV